MILRWRPDGTQSWNLGTITSCSGQVGQVWMDYLGQQAQSAGLLDIFKQYLTNLAKLVPGAEVKTVNKMTARRLLVKMARALALTLCWLMRRVRMDGFMQSQNFRRLWRSRCKATDRNAKRENRSKRGIVQRCSGVKKPNILGYMIDPCFKLVILGLLLSSLTHWRMKIPLFPVTDPTSSLRVKEGIRNHIRKKLKPD